MSENVTKKVYELEITGEDSVNSLKIAIEQLNEKLQTLNQTSKEYKETLEELTKLQAQLADAMNGISESTEKTEKSISGISEKLSEMGETISEVSEAIDGLGDIDGDIIEAFVDGFVDGMGDAANSIDNIEEKLDNLDDVEVKVNVETDDTPIENLSNTLEKLEDIDMSVTVDVDDSQIEKVTDEIEQIDNVDVTINVDANSESLDNVTTTLDNLEDVDVKVDIDVDESSIGGLTEKLDEINNTNVSVNVGVNDESLDNLTTTLDNLGDVSVNVNVEANDDSIDGLKETLDNIEDVNVSVGVEVDNSSLDNVTTTLEGIEDVTINVGVEVSDDSLYNLSEDITSVTENLGDIDDGILNLSLSGFTEEMIGAASAATETKTKLDDLVSANSLKELKQQISELKDRLVQLDKGTDEYNDTMTVLIERQVKLKEVMNAGKNEVQAAEGSYNALSQRMSALKQVWKETTDEAARNEIGQQINEINNELKALDASIGNNQRNVGNYANSMREVFTDPRQEIRALRIELAKLEEGSEEYNRTLMRMAELTSEQRKLTEQLVYSSSDFGDILGNMVGITRGVAAGFSVLNATMGLFGDESEDVQKAMLKTQQFMALIQGLSELEGLKDKFMGLIDGIKGFVKRLGILNKDMGTFKDTATQAGGAAAIATDAMNAQGGATASVAEQTRQLTEAEQAEIATLERRIKYHTEMLEKLEQKGLVDGEMAKKVKSNIKAEENRKEAIINSTKATHQQTVADKKLDASEKQLNAETAKGNKLFGIDAALKKLDTKQTAQLAAGNTMAALATKGLSLALKGLKYALISTGIGAIIVLLGELIALIGKGFSSLWNLIQGTEKHKEALAELNEELDLTIDNLDLMLKYYKAIGATSFKQAIKEFNGLREAIDKAREAYEYAKEKFDEDSDEAEDALGKLSELMERQKNLVTDNIIDIQTMLQGIKETEEQRGMTDLEKDLADVNQQFDDAIAFLEQLKKEIPATAIVADNLLKKLNANRELALNQVKEKATKNTTTTDALKKEREEADKLYKQLVDNYKREEEKLKEKYEKEKKLLEKYHKDTKLLTKKYYDDLDKLLTQRQKIEYDKWVAHLNSTLNLEESETEKYMRKQIENMKSIFSSDFGASVENPFEQFFKVEIIDEFGSKTIEVTDDIKESMKRLGLDPHNFDDIQTMIDKWYADKKAIEDAEKALKKFISEQKMLKFNTEDTNLQDELDKTISDIELKYQEIESKSMTLFGKKTGFYSGLSPEDEKQQMEERYDALEVGLQKEYELWLKASKDEALTVEDRNEAIKKLNEVMHQQQTTAVQKQIDANNLLIKSYNNLSNALTNITNSLTSILGSVSDAIMDNANAQLEANEISQEAYEKQFESAKSFQIAQAIINTIAGAVGAFMGITKDTGGWGIAAAAAEAAAVLAAGYAQIQQIRNTKYDKNTTSDNNGGGSTNFQLPNVMELEPQMKQNLTNQNDTDTLNNGGKNEPIECYVVESSITAKQELANKRHQEITF